MKRGPNSDWLCKWDDDQGKAWVPVKWLEASPGTFSLGFKAIMERTHGFYSSGPLVTDLMFPEHRRTSSETPEHSGAARFYQHYRTLSRSGFGFSFYDGINAQNIVVSMVNKYGAVLNDLLVNEIGLIVCEHVWIRGHGNRTAFLADVAWRFLEQLSSVPKILRMRVSDWAKISSQFERVRRIQVVPPRDNRPHYTPLRHDWDSEEPAELGQARECAIIFHPAGHEDRFQFALPLHIPECVLKQMFCGRKTLFLAAGTCESQMQCLQYFLEQMTAHNLPPPGRPFQARRACGPACVFGCACGYSP